MYFIACLAWVSVLLAPVAQLDRAPDFESGGQGFESLPARQHLIDFESEFLRDFRALDKALS
jgi:hypothetical protein